MADVTVLTPTWNYGRFIGDALASVALQRGVDVEHVVQDRESTDATAELARAYDVTWISEPDCGQSDALNRALPHAGGRWIGWLNADEFYFPDALAALVAEGERTAADVVFGDAALVDAEGRFLRLLPHHRWSRIAGRYYGPGLSTCAAIFRRSALGTRPWDTRLRRVMDWDLVLRLASEGARFSYVTRVVGAFRVHGEQLTAAPRSQFGGEYRILDLRRGRTTGLHRVLGRSAHVTHKLVGGAYYRQVRATTLRGRDLRWFDGAGGAPQIARLVA